MKRPKLPVGIENFQEIRQADFYYVDKTRLIEQLIDQWGKVNLFTRPRRFGKTLNMSNFGLYKAFDALDIEYAKTAVGDKYVYEYMMQNGCRIGGEQSGHIIFSKYASTGDGILTSLKMMEVIMARKKKLSELTADLAIYPQVLENVRVHDKAAAQADVDVQAAVERVAEALGDTGRILVRESGTEPLLRVMVEAESEELCRKYVDQVVEIVRKKGHVAE